MTLRSLLSGKLSKEELLQVPSSFDIIGSKEKAVAIIEMPEQLQSRQKIIAEALMKKHKNVKSVLLKSSPRAGVYRTRELQLIVGDSNTEVKHRESGCTFLLDPRAVYFSPRESTERERIAKRVKKGERIIVFFAGVGPFAIVVAKKAKPADIIGIEINPVAVDYFFKNIRMNKVSNVQVLLGDVLDKAHEFYGRCDRIIMPLPETAFEYLEQAAKCLKKKGTIHLYFFSEEGNMHEWKKKVKNKMEQLMKRCKVSIHKVLPYGPRIWKYRMDIVL